MRIDISPMRESDRSHWEGFANGHKNGCPYQIAAWRDAVVRSYSHDMDYFIARRLLADPDPRATHCNEASNASRDSIGEETVVGILPLVHLRHWLFGNSLVSMPFCDGGGILATDRVVEQMLVEQALRFAETLHVPVVELRQYHPVTCLGELDITSDVLPLGQLEFRSLPGWQVSTTATNKFRMLLDLPHSPDALMQSFKAKLRSQIRKPIKDLLTVKIGGLDLLDDFYEVFAANMRDLGSPVHSKELIFQVLTNFREKANLFVVYRHSIPMACSLTLGFKGVLSNPWASSLRRYSHLAPNMLLYWGMLEYACLQGYQTFDFGRSTVGEGTYRFKEQWGAKPAPLFWYRFTRNRHSSSAVTRDKRRMSLARECWRRLPVPVTRVLGPKIRRYISL